MDWLNEIRNITTEDALRNHLAGWSQKGICQTKKPYGVDAMIEGMVKEVEEFLPLTISEANWDGTSFQMLGENWSFNSLSSWRVSTDERVLFGCYDKISHQEIKKFSNLKIIQIGIQSSSPTVDPFFVLSNGTKIEIFSTDTYEPWTFNIEGIGFFSATPSEPTAFDPG